MNRGILANTLYAYRIGDADGPYPLCEDRNACVAPGRWNKPDAPMLYASEHYATALLELLAVYGADLPANPRSVRLTIPGGVSCETFDADKHPGWDAPDMTVARAYGSAWQAEKRSLILLVPSVVGGGEHNILLNLRHPQASQLSRDADRPILWNDQLQALLSKVHSHRAKAV